MADDWKKLKGWRWQLNRNEWDFGNGTFRQNDPEFIRAGHKAQNILDKADLEKDYGILEYSNAEAFKFSSDAVPAAQNAVATLIQDTYRRMHDKNGGRFGYHIDEQEFFNAYPEYRQRVLNTPLPKNPVFLQQKALGDYTVADYYPKLAQAKTVGDLQNWLVSTVDQGIRTAATNLSNEKGQNFSDTYSAMRLGVVESISTYKPTREVDGITQTNQFLVHAGMEAYKASKSHMRSEKGYGDVKGSSLDAMDGDVSASSILGSEFQTPEYEPGFENALWDAQNDGRWGKYGYVWQADAAVEVNGATSGLAKRMGISEGSVIPAWKDIAKYQPEVFGKAISAVEAGKQVPFLFGRHAGVETAEDGSNLHTYDLMKGFMNPGDVPAQVEEVEPPWADKDVALLRKAGGVQESDDYSYRTGMYTTERYANQPSK